MSFRRNRGHIAGAARDLRAPLVRASMKKTRNPRGGSGRQQDGIRVKLGADRRTRWSATLQLESERSTLTSLAAPSDKIADRLPVSSPRLEARRGARHQIPILNSVRAPHPSAVRRRETPDRIGDAHRRRRVRVKVEDGVVIRQPFHLEPGGGACRNPRHVVAIGQHRNPCRVQVARSRAPFGASTARRSKVSTQWPSAISSIVEQRDVRAALASLSDAVS